LATHRAQLAAALDYYTANAKRCAYFEYFAGMIRGVLVNIVLAFGLVFFARNAAPWLWHDVDLENKALAEAFGCVVAGGIGTFFSVVLRMTTGSFHIDYEIGRRRLRLIGSFRPFIGAASGLALFFAAESGVVKLPGATRVMPNYKEFYLLAFFAFLAGFSERFARETFLNADQEVAAAQGAPAGGPPANPDANGAVVQADADMEVEALREQLEQIRSELESAKSERDSAMARAASLDEAATENGGAAAGSDDPAPT